MRGEKEQICLGFIKKRIFTNNGNPIIHPVLKKTYSEVEDNLLAQEQLFLINREFYKSCFGLLEEDRSEIIQILRNAKPNRKLSEFPDFLFNYGFIEHF